MQSVRSKLPGQACLPECRARYRAPAGGHGGAIYPGTYLPMPTLLEVLPDSTAGRHGILFATSIPLQALASGANDQNRRVLEVLLFMYISSSIPATISASVSPALPP